MTSNSSASLQQPSTTSSSSPDPKLAPSAAYSPPTSTAANASPNRHQQRGRQAELERLNNPGNLTSSTSTLSESPSSDSPTDRNRTLRKPSPGLLARMKLLDSANKARIVSSPILGQDKIGRIPESQLRELDSFHRTQSLVIERRGREWSGVGTPPALLPQTTGVSDTGSAIDLGRSAVDMDPVSQPSIDSDQSSIISTSDHGVPSDSDQSEETAFMTEDTQKYRLPELEKVQSPTSAGATEFGTATIITNETSRAPTPPPKDTPPVPESPATEDGPILERGSDLENYLRNRSLSRANSIYSLSRVSFTNQIQQLTSVKLPHSSSLASSIRAIPTSTAAGRALGEAANQIQQWIKKASEVLNGLDAEDDVEWAAAAGRDGLAEVDAAITRFESLVNIYVGAIEELQSREDIASLSSAELNLLVEQMEEVISKWSNIKSTLQGVKKQVEIAMEWEELWNSVLGEIGMEIDALNRLVFEMEERRHRIALAEESQDVELGELETIVEEAPRNNTRIAASNRFSFTPAFGSNSPLLSPTTETKHEDSNLLALFARMQPLRASLDFLPMRLSHFSMSASPNFPSACRELDQRKDALEDLWQKLETDAEALRRELGEDRWVHLFRNAGDKAIKMWQSVTRSIEKLRIAFEENTDSDYIAMKLRSYEEKKPHYPPAIERILSVIDKGVKDRLTVNGEILRVQSDIRHKLTELCADIKEMDAFIEETKLNKSQQLRDSISTILSTEHSFNGNFVDTPGSSPASSTIMSRKNSDRGNSTPRKSRQTSFASSSSRAGSSSATQRRISGLPTPSSSQIPQKTPLSRSSAVDARGSVSPSPRPTSRLSASTPNQNRRLSTQSQSPQDARPRWTSSSNLNGTITGHNFKPLSATTPSPHRKTPPVTKPRVSRSVSSQSSIPTPSPLSRASLASPPPSAGSRPMSTTPAHSLNPPPNRKSLSFSGSPATPNRRPGSSLNTSSALKNPASGVSSGRRSSLLTPSDRINEQSGDEEEKSPSVRAKPARPVSQLTKRQSLLPQPTNQRTVSGPSGLTSRALEDRPRWRGA